jgi:hypothetical protein
MPVPHSKPKQSRNLSPRRRGTHLRSCVNRSIDHILRVSEPLYELHVVRCHWFVRLSCNFPTKNLHELHKPAPADVILSHSVRSPTGIGQLVSLLRLSSQHNTNSFQSQSCFVRGIELVHVHDTLLDFMPDNKSTLSASFQSKLVSRSNLDRSLCSLTSLSH